MVRNIVELLVKLGANEPATVPRRRPVKSRRTTAPRTAPPSRGLRRRYRLAGEESDDEIADRDMGSDDGIALPAEAGRAITAPSSCSPPPRSTAVEPVEAALDHVASLVDGRARSRDTAE